MLYISGGSRGIGLSMALKAARDGAKIVIAAKTAEPHPKECHPMKCRVYEMLNL